MGKPYENDEDGRGGHLGDIIRLFLGDSSGMPLLSGDQIEVFHVIATANSLAFDSTAHNQKSAENYRNWLQERRSKYGLKSIPAVSTFIPNNQNEPPAWHELYTHLGWKHDYGGENQKKWLTGQKIQLDMLNSLFDFSIFSRAKLDSFGALIYYVHVLGDHEVTSITTAHTRIPIERMDEQIREQGWQGWYNEKERKPESTIINDLKVHLKILFEDNGNQAEYQKLMSKIDPVYGRNVPEKARALQKALFDSCPILLRSANFSKNFYGKYKL
jgi:hypothetical protein